ncbi:Integrator complex subunit 9 [Armadillidium vulgare]|nr:Integrator complex subunit 9 [Armadillidium vulgare]
MLDCGLDMTSIMHFLPLPLVPSQRLNTLNYWMPRDADLQLEGELRECANRIFIDSPPEFKTPSTGFLDYSEVDVILVSNYLSMLALPFVTNGTGFKGVVLMTEPTMQIGRLFMEELVTFIDRSPKAKHAYHWKNNLRILPQPLNEAKSAKAWQLAYNMKAVNESLSHVQIVAYNEKIDVCGALKVTAVSSGFCLGSCNWVITSDHEKVAYLSGSSTLTTHPRPIEKASLKGADVLLMTGLNHTPIYNPDTMIGEFCLAVSQTVRNGGCALVPCYPSGVVYDLFECLSNHLDNVNLLYVPMYFISPVADSSLAYSNIFSEWLSSGKQGKVYQMEDPFPHAHLIRTGRLKAFKNIYSDAFNAEFRQPCIVFCGHPSLRFGDAVHFIEMWGNNPLNAILFTEPEFDFVDALAPFQPLAMRPVNCPIDTSLNFNQAKILISDLKPNKLIVPEVYLRPPATAPHRTDLVLDVDEKTLTYSENEFLNVGLKRHMETVQLTPELAASLNPVAVKPNLNATSVTAVLCEQDNRYTLKPVDEETENIRQNIPPSYLYGSLSIDDFVQRLAQAGFTDPKVEEDIGCTLINLKDEAVVQIKENSTHIITSKRKIREKLRDVLLNCLNHY